MKNCVSFEMAQQLQAAGFPNPEQLMSSDVTAWTYKAGHAMMDRIPISHPTIYAPTVADILPLIDGSVFYSHFLKGFRCHLMPHQCRDQEVFKSQNIHDAAALAWLHINENK